MEAEEARRVPKLGTRSTRCGDDELDRGQGGGGGVRANLANLCKVFWARYLQVLR